MEDSDESTSQESFTSFFLVTLLVIFIVLFRYDLLKFSKSAEGNSSAQTSLLETETAVAAPAKGRNRTIG